MGGSEVRIHPKLEDSHQRACTLVFVAMGAKKSPPIRAFCRIPFRYQDNHEGAKQYEGHEEIEPFMRCFASSSSLRVFVVFFNRGKKQCKAL
jgi:hypothetical protein